MLYPILVTWLMVCFNTSIKIFYGPIEKFDRKNWSISQLLIREGDTIIYTVSYRGFLQQKDAVVIRKFWPISWASVQGTNGGANQQPCTPVIPGPFQLPLLHSLGTVTARMTRNNTPPLSAAIISPLIGRGAYPLYWKLTVYTSRWDPVIFFFKFHASRPFFFK